MANSEKKVAAKYSILEEADVPGAKLKKPPENCIFGKIIKNDFPDFWIFQTPGFYFTSTMKHSSTCATNFPSV